MPVAVKRGFFTKHNLDVEFVNWAGSTDLLLEAISTGKANAGVGTILRWLKPMEQGFDVKLTAGTHGGSSEICRPGPTQQRPRSFSSEPTDGSPRGTVTTAPHRLPVHDQREEDHAFTLDGEGFAVVEHRSAVTDFQDEAQTRDTYDAEAERLLKDVTGADRVFIFDDTIRRRILGQQDCGDGPRQPATRVHVDHTANAGPQRVRDLLPEEADELLKGRVQVINLWRRSIMRCTTRRLRWPRLPRSDSRNWFRPTSCIPIGSEKPRTDVARFAPHTAFLVPDAPADAPTRESIELRTLVFHKE